MAEDPKDVVVSDDSDDEMPELQETGAAGAEGAEEETEGKGKQNRSEKKCHDSPFYLIQSHVIQLVDSLHH